MKVNDIKKRYKDSLMITNEELDEYAEDRKEMKVIEFENFEKFAKPVKPSRFVTVAGKYISKKGYGSIIRNSK